MARPRTAGLPGYAGRRPLIGPMIGPLVAPPFLLIAGDIDLKNDIYPMVLGDADVVLPVETSYAIADGAHSVGTSLE